MDSSALCEGRKEDIRTAVKLMQVFRHYFCIERNKFAVVEVHLPTDRTTHCLTVMCWTGWLWLHMQQTDGEIKGRQLHIPVTLRVLLVTCVCYSACVTSPCYSACVTSSCDTTRVTSLCYTALPVYVTLRLLLLCMCCQSVLLCICYQNVLLYMCYQTM